MLKQRVITALALLAVLLPALFYPSFEPFAALSLVLIVAAGWEWARLNGCGTTTSLLCGGGLGGVLALGWSLGVLEMAWPGLWGAAGGVWLVLAIVVLRQGVAAWSKWPSGVRVVGGLVLIGCAWLALVQAHKAGISFLLSVLTLVWAADIAAYFGGRALGRRKLAPAISPGKTWEGVYSGVAGVCLLAVLWCALDARGVGSANSLFGQLWAQGPLLAVLAIAVLTTMSVVGDLFESLVKRSAGMKDSSGLLPGHGGVLDRVDALLPVLPLAMLFVSFS